MDPLLPKEQASFKKGCFTVSQILKRASVIEESFKQGHTARLVLVALIAVYDIVWYQFLALKLF